MTMTKEENARYIRDLLTERAGPLQRILGARVEVDGATNDVDRAVAESNLEVAKNHLHDIDAELKRVGYEAKAPHKAAEKRPAETRVHEHRG